jgi:(methylthio)acryloyl-CoA hydratase
VSSALNNESTRLPASLKATREGEIGVLHLARGQKRNALDDETVRGLEVYFTDLENDVKVVVLAAEGPDFSAGLDLSELKTRDVRQGIAHSASWHRTFERIQFGKVPVVAVLQGAVVGGGLELAASAHIRVAERSAFYALPEGSRGIFVGGGGSVRISRLIGVARMMDMMLTGRTYSAEDGQAMGLSTYLVEEGGGFATAMELARRIAGNAPMTNFAITHVLPRIAESDMSTGFTTEALISSIAQSQPEAKARVEEFLNKRGPKVTRE